MRYLLLLMLLAGCSKPAPPKPTQAEIDLAACRAAIKATLIDPESAQFSEESCHEHDATERACLLRYNAKNRMGGYVGRKYQGCWIDQATGRVKSLT